MCGIGGKISFSEKPDPSVAGRINDRMTHRGPDAYGVYANGPAMLAHRRLSILDLSDAGRQPMSNEDGTVHIVFNGEIYNYRELKDRVANHTFRSETDTEVLLHLYEEEGIECLEHLRGMFAFGIWDEQEEQLFLARDRMGQKPLFVRNDPDDGTFWFGSTIKAVLADPEIDANPDLTALRSYLTYQYVPHPKTGFEGIEQLRPAEYAIVKEDNVRQQRYWTFSYADQSNASADVLADRLRNKLQEATKLRMRSDVPVGTFLSGGIDSSAVTALMDEVSDRPVRTYSIGFGNEAYSELDFARLVADKYDTDHHEYTVTTNSIEVLPDLIEEYEMPFGDPSALPTYYVSQVASDDITVVLSGDAGDETFAGYDRYTRDWIAQRLSELPSSIRRAGVGALEALPSSVRRRNAVRFPREGLKTAEGDEVERYARLITHFIGERADAIWDGPEPDDELAFLRNAFEEANGPTRRDQITYVDAKTYLPCDLLVKVDRASMAHSLEVRSPFLDHEFVEFAANVPAKYKWRRGNKKWLLKRAFRGELPDEVLDREKQGFGVPINEWFRGELREYARDHLDRLGSREPFNARELDKMFEEHQAERRNHGYRMWNVVMLEAWYERFIDD